MKAYIYEWREKIYFDRDDEMETFYEIEKYNIDLFSRLINIITNDFFPPLFGSVSSRTNIVFIFLFDDNDERKWSKAFRILNRKYKFKKNTCCGDYKYLSSFNHYYSIIEVYIYNKIDFDLIPDDIQNEIKNAKKFVILEFTTMRDF